MSLNRSISRVTSETKSLLHKRKILNPTNKTKCFTNYVMCAVFIHKNKTNNTQTQTFNYSKLTTSDLIQKYKSHKSQNKTDETQQHYHQTSLKQCDTQHSKYNLVLHDIRHTYLRCKVHFLKYD